MNRFRGEPKWKKGRLSIGSGRLMFELDADTSPNSSILELSFSRAVTATPIPFTNPLDLSISSTFEEELLDLSVSSTQKNDSFEVISTQPLKLPTAKLKDLCNLLPYIKQKNCYETFFKNLVPPKRGRKAHSKLVDHFEADMDQGEKNKSNMISKSYFCI